MTEHSSSGVEAPPERCIEDARLKEKAYRRLKDLAWNLFLIIFGNLFTAISINGICLQHQMLSGGLTGLSLGLKYIFPDISVPATYFLLNVPVFLLGWRYVGRRFFLYSLCGMTVLTLQLKLIHVVIPVQDKILASLLAGIIMGFGGGIVLRSRGSAGGTDVLSVMLLNLFSIGVGNTFLGFNVIVLTLAAIYVSVDAALYTLIFMFVTAKVMDIVLTGLSKRKALIIISPEWRAISTKVLEKINRGVTQLRGWGGFTGKEEVILYVVTPMHELSRVKNIIRRIDPNAFVVIQDTAEVMGRLGNQPHW